MQRSIDDRLGRLRSRRGDSSTIVVGDAFTGEAFEKRTTDKATKYALGAMQEVAPRSTEISLEEAARVQAPLKQRLNDIGINPSFELQGSVPINVHIKGVSDVDLLMVDERYLRYIVGGAKGNTYVPWVLTTSIEDELLSLRSRAEGILRNHFYEANVDTSGAKSIQLTGGSLRRKVDVVPSFWFDSIEYQRTERQQDRGIYIVDRLSRESILNYPFKYMDCIRQASDRTNRGALMAIRLAKNVKNDSDHDIELSSYDIGSLFYHCASELIFYMVARDLTVLAGAERWLAYLVANRAYTETLETPDGTRKIIDSGKKWASLGILSREITSLAKEVDLEIRTPFNWDVTDHDVRRRLSDRSIPLAPGQPMYGY